MHARNVHFPLEHGFIHNWLAAGPQAIPVDIKQFEGEHPERQISQLFYEPASGITQNPVERGPLSEGLFKVGEYSGSWEYYACREDHLVEHSGSFTGPQYLRSWAYTQLNSKTAREVTLVLSAYGPADVWLNDSHVQRLEYFDGRRPGSAAFNVMLNKGVNKILVRFETPALRACPHAVALQVRRPAEGQKSGPDQLLGKSELEVSIPSLIQPISRRNKFERAAAMTYLGQDVFSGDDQIRLHWPADLEHSSPAVVRLQTPTGMIYAEATVDGTAGDQLFLQHPKQIPEGPYRIVIMPLTSEYYEHNMRITREFSLWNQGRSVYSSTAYGTYEERRKEALVSAAMQTGLFSEIAKMALGQWAALEADVFLKHTSALTSTECLGCLGLLARFEENPQFPAAIRQKLDELILGCVFEPGSRSESASGLGQEVSEAEQILSCAAEILAGQHHPLRTFANSAQTGQWHREHGEKIALEWLTQRGRRGFSDWDSNDSFAGMLVALSHLVDLAETKSIWEMAAVLMDKLFATLAINSYKGVFGSTHGRTSAAFVKGGLMEPTSGIARLMWGTGVFNHHTAGQVSLACMERYELPELIPAIANSLPDELWGCERHGLNEEQAVNKVTYKTPDGMLCSAQDHRPGQRGAREHIWQATLGASAAVFVTHPACSSENDAYQPNFWAGNVSLPRVAQWKDALIALYQLPEDDWMGFTHAYFPSHAFDETAIRQGWAFARKGDGYLALTASQGFEPVLHGQYAMRELRSYGRKNVWLCQLGRAALDGDFNSFQQKVLALPPVFSDLSVSWTTLRAEELSFGWQSPFLRAGQEQPLSGFGHYQHLFAESEYPSSHMDIRFSDSLLRLNFGSPE